MIGPFCLHLINPCFNLLRGGPPPLRILTAPPFYSSLEWGMPGAQNAYNSNGFCTNASQNAAELRTLMGIIFFYKIDFAIGIWG